MESFKLYRCMQLSVAFPDGFTIPMAVNSCGELKWLNSGKNVHGLASKLGLFASNSAVGSSFIYFYSKCGVMEDASLLFGEALVRDVVSWTALLIGYLHNGDSEKALEVLYLMHKMAEYLHDRPNYRTLEGGLQACGNLVAGVEGRCLHGLTTKTGCSSSHTVQSSLLSMYSRCGTVEETHASFLDVLEKDMVCWTSLISVYAKYGMIPKCIESLHTMEISGIQPDGILISCILLGLANSMRTIAGRVFHGHCVGRGYVLDHIVSNALLSMYCRFGLMSYAEKLFNRELMLVSESWESMVLSYRKAGLDAKCIKLFRGMRFYGIELDSNSCISAICSCSQLGEIYLGCSIHCVIIKSPKYKDLSVFNSLIDMYASHDDLKNAWKLVCQSRSHTATWNTLMSCYSKNGRFYDVLILFNMMVSEEVIPDTVTLVSVLSACSNISSSEHAENICRYIKHARMEEDMVVATSLIDMYAKCGQPRKAREVFDSLMERDMTCWNAMISGYALHGEAKNALELFNKMDESGVVPNGITFLCTLSSCARAGLVIEGKYVFSKMSDYSVEPNLKHYACMVDLLGRSGHLREAEIVILSMPVCPDGCLWGSLLGACRDHQDFETGIRVAQHAIESDPENDGYYILLCNMYTSSGKWKEADSLREMMRQRGVMKSVAWSAV